MSRYAELLNYISQDVVTLCDMKGIGKMGFARPFSLLQLCPPVAGLNNVMQKKKVRMLCEVSASQIPTLHICPWINVLRFRAA